MKFFPLLIGIMFIPLTAWGATCKGTVVVVDEMGTGPIPGIRVDIVGTSMGASTNADGFFSINNCEIGDTLRFSLPGLARQDIKITPGNINNLNIKMLENLGEAYCEEGYYMDWSTGHSVCIQCPTHDGVFTSSSAGTGDISTCYIPSGSQFLNTSGIYQYTKDCVYSE